MARVTDRLIAIADEMLKSHRYVKVNRDGSVSVAPGSDIVLEDGETVLDRAQFNGYQKRGWPAEF